MVSDLSQLHQLISHILMVVWGLVFSVLNQIHLQKKIGMNPRIIIETRESECRNGLTSNGWFKKQRGYWCHWRMEFQTKLTGVYCPKWKFLEVYNSEKDKWTKVANMPTTLRLFSTLSIDDMVFVFGGYQEDLKSGIDLTYQYDVSEDKNCWKTYELSIFEFYLSS